MGQRLAARNRDDTGAEAGEMVDSAKHLIDRDRLGNLVVLVAIGAGEIAEAHGHDLRHDDVVSRGQSMSHNAKLPQLAGRRFDPALALGSWDWRGGDGGGHSGLFNYSGEGEA